MDRGTFAFKGFEPDAKVVVACELEVAPKGLAVIVFYIIIFCMEII